MSNSRALAIVVVDDEPTVLQSLRMQLREFGDAGVQVELAESGEEALELLEELEQDGVEVPVVISDQLMPGMKGEALLAAAYAKDPRVHTIMLTGRASSDAVGAAVNTAHLYRFVGKPWDAADLVLTVRGALQAWRDARAVEAREAALARTHRASVRFVPARLLECLDRSRVAEVEVGDRADRELAVFFFGTRRPDVLTDEDASTYNALFGALDRDVHAAGGFIYDVSGGAPLAFFAARDVDAAVAVAAAWQQRIVALNDARSRAGSAPLQADVGGCCGPVLLRIHGGERRLFTGALGDAINTAARVQAATRRYAASVLVTGELVARLQRPERFDLRAVDHVLLKGKASPTTLYALVADSAAAT